MLERPVSPLSNSGLPAVSLISIAQALLVAEHLSFRQAAGVLGARQSAVSITGGHARRIAFREIPWRRTDYRGRSPVF